MAPGLSKDPRGPYDVLYGLLEEHHGVRDLAGDTGRINWLRAQEVLTRLCTQGCRSDSHRPSHLDQEAGVHSRGINLHRGRVPVPIVRRAGQEGVGGWARGSREGNENSGTQLLFLLCLGGE